VTLGPAIHDGDRLRRDHGIDELFTGICTEKERLRPLLFKFAGCNADALIERIIGDVRSFVGGAAVGTI